MRAITGSAQPQITRESLSPIEFFYPPLDEQERIVAKLDGVFDEINHAHRKKPPHNSTAGACQSQKFHLK